MPVWIDDKRDARFAGTTLGLPDRGYPNVALYAPGGEYLSRIVGFVGNPEPDEWYGLVKESVVTAEALAAARKSAQEDPANWRNVAEALTEIEGREADALAAAEKVPGESRDEAFGALLAKYRARAKWVEVRDAIEAASAEGRKITDAEASREALKGAYTGAITELDDFLRDHVKGCERTAARAYAMKARLLFQLERKEEARAVAKILLEQYPESEETDNLLRGIR